MAVFHELLGYKWPRDIGCALCVDAIWRRQYVCGIVLLDATFVRRTTIIACQKKMALKKLTWNIGKIDETVTSYLNGIQTAGVIIPETCNDISITISCIVKQHAIQLCMYGYSVCHTFLLFILKFVNYCTWILKDPKCDYRVCELKPMFLCIVSKLNENILLRSYN